MSFSSTLYNTIFRRNSMFVTSIFATAFFYDIVFNRAVDRYFDSVNQGKQWKDIRAKYIKADEEDDEE